MFYRCLLGYQPVAQDANYPGDRHGRRGGLFLISITALVSGLLGFAGGSLFSTYHPDPSLKTVILHEPGVNIREIYTGIDTTFTYNRTFGADPEVDTATLDAWNSIVPRTSATLLIPIGRVKNAANEIQRSSWTGHGSIPTAQRPVLHTVRRAPAALPCKLSLAPRHHAIIPRTDLDLVVPAPVPLQDPASRHQWWRRHSIGSRQTLLRLPAAELDVRRGYDLGAYR